MLQLCHIHLYAPHSAPPPPPENVKAGWGVRWGLNQELRIYWVPFFVSGYLPCDMYDLKYIFLKRTNSSFRK